MQSQQAPGLTRTTSQHRFQALDGLRGIAALTVIQMHLPFLFAAHMPFPHAYLAVDFFFMLSGFVLNFAYAPRLDSGWPTRLFLRERIFRLYPLYLIALPFALAHLFFTKNRDHAPFHPGEIVAIVLFALVNFPLPAWTGATSPELFPANVPSWSLFYELFANVVHGLLLRHWDRAKLALVTLVFGMLLIPISLHRHGLNLGSLRGELLMGAVRVTFSYTLGMLLLDLWQEGHLRKLRSFAGSAALLAMILLSPLLPHGNGLVDLFAVMILFPLILILAANTASDFFCSWVVTFLGTLSYPIYVLHVPAFAVFTVFWGALLHTKPADHAPVSGIVYIVFLLAVCYLLERFYDVPARRWLRERTRLRNRV